MKYVTHKVWVTKKLFIKNVRITKILWSQRKNGKWLQLFPSFKGNEIRSLGQKQNNSKCGEKVSQAIKGDS